MLNKIFKKIENKEPFSLIRYGDGEKNIIDNIPCKRAGFSFNPHNINDHIFRSDLWKALQYDGGENYYVGVDNEELKMEVKGTIISPMVFVNENYLEFLKQLKEVAKEIPVVLVVNKMSRLTNIPFNFTEVFTLKDNAWHSAQHLDGDILEYLDMCKDQHLVLVAGGVYSCTLIHKLWSKDRNHIFLDIGSTLDPYLFGQHTRQYHKRLNKC